MADFRVLSDTDIKGALMTAGKLVQKLHQDRMLAQKEVGGSPYPALKSSTVQQKSGTLAFYTDKNGNVHSFIPKKNKVAGGVQANANKRMIATNDFKNNAFLYSVTNNVLTFMISGLPHKFNKTNRAAWSAKKGKKTADYKPYSYDTLARWQLRGKFQTTSGKASRNSNNAGADFFGVTPTELDTIESKSMKALIPMITKNTVNHILNFAK